MGRSLQQPELRRSAWLRTGQQRHLGCGNQRHIGGLTALIPRLLTIVV